MGRPRDNDSLPGKHRELVFQPTGCHSDVDSEFLREEQLL